MPSPTQRQLTLADLDRSVTTAFGIGATDGEPLSGGTFGSVWRVRLDDGRDVIVKSAPADGARLLTYERGMLHEEANYLRLAGAVDGVPTAELLYECDDFVVMSCLPGIPMWRAGTDVTGAREQAGAAIARLHGVTGDRFGYTGDRPSASNWPDAYAGMVEAILDDAVEWAVRLPMPADDLRGVVAGHRELLATVTTPSLLHFDLWDGNVLVDAEARLTGLVDGERYLFGDPLVDFASPVLFGTATPEHPFVRGYQRVRPFDFGQDARTRLRLYQMYLYLVMTVEVPSRGIDPDGETAQRSRRFLTETVAYL